MNVAQEASARASRAPDSTQDWGVEPPATIASDPLAPVCSHELGENLRHRERRERTVREAARQEELKRLRELSQRD